MLFEARTSSFVFRPSEDLAPALAAWLKKEERQFFRLAEVKQVTDWTATREGKIHAAILQSFILSDKTLPLSVYNQIQRNIINKGQDPRGRPKQYHPSRKNLTYVRAVRLYLFNKLIAQALNVPINDVPPEAPPPGLTDTEFEPIETLSILLRFETWAEHRLPREAYIVYTREDRTLLTDAYNHSPEEYPEFDPSDWTECDVPCVRFEDYLRIRENPKTKVKIEGILSAHYESSIKQEFEEITNKVSNG